MAESLGDAVLELRTDDRRYLAGIQSAETRGRRFERGLQGIEARALSLGQRLDGLGSRLQRVGQTMSLAISAPLLGFAALSVKTASDVEELTNLIKVTFGEAADDVEGWAERTAAAVNRSSIALLRAAGDFAAFLKPLGVGPDMAVTMSKALSQLVTDVSSFRNIAEDRVFDAFFSGLAGETEAVRRLGIDLGAAAIEAELLRLGFQGNAQDATQAQKAVARYNLIIQQTRDAQGDAARTAGSFENQSRALQATLTDIRADIGERLLPTVTDFVGGLNRLGQRFLALSDEAKAWAIGIAGAFAVLGPGLITLGLFTRALSVAIVGLVSFGRGVRVVIRAVLAEMALLAAAFATPVVAATAAAAAILGAWVLFKETIAATLQAVIDTAEFWLVQQFRNRVERPFLEAVNELVEALPDFVRDQLGLDPIEIPVEIGGSAAAVALGGLGEARAAAQREIGQIETEFEALVGKVKGLVPEGMWDLFFGDFDTVGREIDSATGKLDALIDKLPGGSAAGSGPGGAGGAGAIADGLDGLGGAAGRMGAAVDQGAGTASRAIDTLGREVDFAIDRMTDELLRGEFSWRSFGRTAIGVIQEVISSALRAQTGGFGGGGGIGSLLVKGLGAVLGGFGGGGGANFASFANVPVMAAGFAAGGRPPVGRASIVGEFGPEVFVPDTAGTIVPNHELRGLGGRREGGTYYIDARGADRTGLARLEAMIRSLDGSIEPRAVGAVSGARRRDPGLFGGG